MRQRIILAALCFLLTVLNIKAGESAYYYVGVPNVGDPWSGTLPVLFIDTESEVNSKEVYVKGKYYIDALGLEGYQSLGTKENPLPLQIKGRGNWTWTGFNKKPYRLKFDSKASPLGMKSNKHFNLLANADDHNAFLNNTVGFQLSRLLKLAYTPEQRPVEVVLNGDYIGLYMLTDKIRVEKNRVNIVEQSDEETDDGRRWPEYSQSNINDRKNNFKNKISQKVNYLRQQWGNGISSIWAVPDDEADDDCWYGLDGRKINGVPTRHGLFIHKGRKVVL